MTTNNINKFVIYKSSAGSGKTFTLAKEYLALSLPNARFEDILAITFTNKAVNEMKTRILKELSKMKNPVSMDMNDGMIKDLSNRLGYDVNTLSEKARKLEFRILHNYSDFAVSTIDSFVQKIIQVFAYDLDIPLGFELILEEEEMREKAVRDVFSSIGIDEGFTNVVLRYVDESMQTDKSWNMEKKLVELSKVILAEDAPEKLKQLNELSMQDFMEIQDKLKNENRKVEKRCKDIGNEAMKLFADNDLDASDFYQGNRGVYSYLEKLSRGEVKGLNSYACKFIDDANCRVSKKSNKQELLLELSDKYIIAWLNELKELYSEDYHTRKLLLEKIYTMAVLNAVSEKINEYYRENNVLHISEQNKKLSDVVLLESIPFVYERLGERYKHFLIDEFQDTSVLQWQNLVPLLENSLSSNERSLSIVVGDAKQAIYRFRQGDVEQFINLPNLSISTDNEYVRVIVGQRERVLKEVSDIQNLSVNYRTKRDIVNFNNEFFTHLMGVAGVLENQMLRDIYLGKDYIDNKKEVPDLYQAYPEKRNTESGGYVSVKLVDSDSEREDILEEVYETIRNLVEEKGYSYGDIAVLGRDKKVLIAVSSYLSDRQVCGKDIPIESAESFLLIKNEEVLFLVSLLKLLHNRYDDVEILNVLEYLQNRKKYKIDTSEILCANYFIGYKKDSDIFDFLKNIGYELNPTELLSMTLYDCCETLVREFSLKDRGMEYVTSFLNQVAIYSTRNRQDLSEFLEEFSYKKNSYTLNTTASSDAVKLMTIHKSKGLEFPIIIYPIFSTKGNNADDMWVSVDKDKYLLPISLVSSKVEMSESKFNQQYFAEQYKKQLDDINILYVALTRPEEKLFVVSPRRGVNKEGAYTTIESYITSFVKEGDMYEKGENTCKELPREDKLDKKQEENKPINKVYNTFVSEETVISVSPEKTAAIEEGILIHDIFSNIYTAEDIDSVINMFKLKKGLHDDYVETLRKRVERIVYDERYSKYFDSKYSVKTECEILYVNEAMHQMERPDRVVFADGETWVVDFKTGYPMSCYDNQIQRYVDVIKAMGYPNVRGEVVYC